MDNFMTTVTAVILAFVCVTSLPVNEGDDVSNLANLLGKLRSLHRKRLDSHSWGHFKSTSGNDDKPQSSDLADSTSDVAEDPEDVLPEDVPDMRKRQGAWSYDYGLGGGRFGKRNYGEYGFGGGRFGRDVDHVDLSD
ncbi:uncharacterized protein LOC124269021 [Haliotis rubra]|uniref:uncharacterized protein LOC124269021 n=1 Tax=Haliotis rubra TaxID=36100 RepID=UPI001EE60C7D|nr:uncharacterized protein LOC124269021 [Haliotis rubra]XP_046560007.1 uncharacterized protein LOC124269021 [Haliotis rubra]